MALNDQVAALERLSRGAAPSRAATPMRARYDSAQTTADNTLYFANADGLSARAANSPGVRSILRNRSRYEVANNGYAGGMVNTLANYIVGTGPALQVLSDDDMVNDWLENEFNTWMRETGFGAKLWTIRHSQSVDGEGFGMVISNPRVPTPVKLDVLPIEADMVADGPLVELTVNPTDGIELDEAYNVTAYRLLPYHPGDNGYFDISGNSRRIPASIMFHLYRCSRAGQIRGIPDLTPGLMLYPVMRRYTYAALHAAETAARISGVLQTKFTPEEVPSVPELEATDLNVNEWMTLPEGWELKQIASEHPNTNYPQFKKEVVIECARPIDMPANIALGTSEGYNYSSGKLDHVGFYKSIGIQQSNVERVACAKVLNNWFEVASLIPGYMPASLRSGIPTHTWIWDGQEIIDPRENTGQVEALANGLDSIDRLHAKRGLRTDNVFKANAKALGISIDEYRTLLMQKWFGAPPQEEAVDEETGEPMPAGYKLRRLP